MGGPWRDKTMGTHTAHGEPRQHVVLQAVEDALPGRGAYFWAGVVMGTVVTALTAGLWIPMLPFAP